MQTAPGPAASAPKEEVPLVSFTTVLAVMTVSDFDAGRDWYQRLFNRPADQEPMTGLAEWMVSPGAGLQLAHDPERAGHASVTLVVDDLDALSAELSSRGLIVGETIRGVISTIATITDPEGNTITFAQLHENQEL